MMTRNDIDSVTYSGVESKLQFKMAHGPEVAGMFAMNHTTGLLTTIGWLDREITEKYVITGENNFLCGLSFYHTIFVIIEV